MKFLNTPQEEHLSSLRRFLTDAYKVCIILFCLIASRAAFVFMDEARLTRSEFGSQTAAARAVLQEQGKELNNTMSRINVNSNVLVERLDKQMTHARAEISKATESTNRVAKEESKELKKTLTENLASTTEAIKDVAEETKQSGAAQPVQVVVPDTKAVESSSTEETVQAPIVINPLPNTLDNCLPKKHKRSWKTLWMF